MGLAILMYAQDYDETDPPACLENLSTNFARDYPGYNWQAGTVHTWRSLTLPYIKTVGILACPSNPNHTKYGQDWLEQIPVSYGGNAWYGTGSAASSNGNVPEGALSEYPGDNLSLAGISAPATVIYVCESTYPWEDFEITSPYYDNFHNGTGSALFAGHTLTTNFILCDGHAKAMKPLGTINEVNSCDATQSKQLDMWSRTNQPICDNMNGWGIQYYDAYGILSDAQKGLIDVGDACSGCWPNS
jgi:hypothetical protein